MELIGAIFINWDASAVGTWLGVGITSVLTYIIIHQSGRINKEQVNLEKKLSEQQIALQEKINEQQKTIQKRQIKVELFPYKRELYLNLYKVLEFSNALAENILTLDLNEKKSEAIFAIYEIARSQYLGDIQIIIRSLLEADYILPHNISPTVNSIRVSFDDIVARFLTIKTLSQYFDKEISQEKMKEILEHNLAGVKKSAELINSRTPFILSTMPEELDISILDR